MSYLQKKTNQFLTLISTTAIICYTTNKELCINIIISSMYLNWECIVML